MASTFVTKAFRSVAVAALAVFASCSNENAVSSLKGLPSVDVDLNRMRWHFSTSKPVTSIDALKPGSSWKCVQRTAIARSNHTSYFIRKFASDGTSRVLKSTAEFDGTPAAVSSGKFWAQGGAGHIIGSQQTETDRYMLPYGNLSVYLRMSEGKLVEEWVAPQDSDIVGRGYAMVPELIVLGGQTLMESALSNPSGMAFLYASCDLVVRR